MLLIRLLKFDVRLFETVETFLLEISFITGSLTGRDSVLLVRKYGIGVSHDLSPTVSSHTGFSILAVDLRNQVGA